MTDAEGAPLAGVRVLEAGPLLPVPSTGANLARLGASVTRIEAPSGDPARVLYGGWLHELYGHDKESVVLDLTTGAGRDALGDLVENTDVVVVGHRPAAARRLGLDADQIRIRRPDAIHCSITGYASDGPDRDRPGHDLSFLARSGALTEAAGPTAIGSRPRRPAIPVADLAAGAVATQAILAALIGRGAGRPVRPIEIPIADVSIAWMAPRLGHAIDNRFAPALDPANDIYRCADGRHIAIAAIEPRFWSSLCDVLRADVELPDDVASWPSSLRIERTPTLLRVLTDAFRSRTSEAWLRVLHDAGVPADPVLDSHDVVSRLGADVAGWRHRAVPLHLVPERHCHPDATGSEL